MKTAFQYYAITTDRRHLPAADTCGYDGCYATVREPDGRWVRFQSNGKEWVPVAMGSAHAEPPSHR